MAQHAHPTGGLPAHYLTTGSASFAEFLRQADPDLLPGHRSTGELPVVPADAIRHGTTIVGVTCSGGVVMAGDRRATMGNVIAQRDIEKVFAADEYSAIGIAGAVGPAIEMVRLFQVELEHYEKIEGHTLSLDGKANRLASMIRANLAMAMQGLAVVPLFAGFDPDSNEGRIFSYDVTGARYEEHSFFAVGSGSVFARGALKKRFRDDVDINSAVRLAVDALYDAADDDSATGGPDLTRRIFPVVVIITAEGFRRIPDDEIGTLVESIVAERQLNPGG
jgi:proteasome beta subunit